MKQFESDVIIVGTGVAGLYCALNLSADKKITIITKANAEDCDSYLAQGGICVLKNDADYNSYFEDTLKAGHYENNHESVDLMIRNSQSVIQDLIKYGTRFEKDEKGDLKFTREGAHSTPRILYHEDITGEEITSHLLEAVKKLPNVTIFENTTMIDIISAVNDKNEKSCKGIIVECGADSKLSAFGETTAESGSVIVRMNAPEVVWACGGIGGLYEHSTNFPHLTGDALGIALKHGIALQNPDYIQIHPTTLYSEKKGRSFLISESVRGEGGILLDKNGNRFVNELLPRDVVANAIFAQMEKDGTKHVMLSMEKIPQDEIRNHFKHIYEKCLEEGYDCTKEPVPVVPAQHYFMGGVDVNSFSRTNMNGLYAVGETSCNGVHGKNRLASNSLLESLVFARIAANKINEEFDEISKEQFRAEALDILNYSKTEKIFEQYKKAVLSEIERMKKYHELNHNEIECRQLDSASA